MLTPLSTANRAISTAISAREIARHKSLSRGQFYIQMQTMQSFLQLHTYARACSRSRARIHALMCVRVHTGPAETDCKDGAVCTGES